MSRSISSTPDTKMSASPRSCAGYLLRGRVRFRVGHGVRVGVGVRILVRVRVGVQVRVGACGVLGVDALQ